MINGQKSEKRMIGCFNFRRFSGAPHGFVLGFSCSQSISMVWTKIVIVGELNFPNVDSDLQC